MRTALMLSWQKPTWLTILLWPPSLLYRTLFTLRGLLYKWGVLHTYTAPVPVIVVGNLSVGGTGKTPMVIYLVERLRELGYQPGVISRGYGGEASSYPLLLDSTTSVAESGDEPALIVKRTGVPMVVGPDRAADIELLLDRADVNVVISDDGLQHIALKGDIEICLIDETSPNENTCLLPAGPWREPLSRLESVDFIVRHNTQASLAQSSPEKLKTNEFNMWLAAEEPQLLYEKPQLLYEKPQPLGEKPEPTKSVEADRVELDTKQPVHAVAGIGNPQRFFDTCRELGLDILEHRFADHHQFSTADLEFGDSLAVLMTEKDAVKCKSIAKHTHWYLPVNAKLSDGFDAALSDRLASLKLTSTDRS